MLKKITYSNFDHNLAILLILIVSLGPAFSFYFPLKVANVSLFTTFLPFVLLVFFYFKNLLIFNDRFTVLMIIFFLIFILTLRQILYDESFLKSLVGNVYVIYIPFFISIYRNFNYTEKRIKTLTFIIEVILFINILNSILFILGENHINNINEYNDDYVEDSRFNGILGGANVQAHFISILFVVYINIKKNIGVISVFLIGLLSIIAIMPTVSRGGIIILLINLVVSLIFLYKSGKNSVKILALLIVILTTIGISTLLNFDQIDVLYSSYIARTEVDDQSGGRLDRIYFAADRLSENILSPFIGIANNRQTESSKLSISDNSVLLVVANLGVFFAYIFLFYVFKQFNLKHIKLTDSRFYVLSILITSITNNSFLYFQWCLIAICGYYIILTTRLNPKINHAKNI